MRVEQSWHERGRAGPDKFIARMQRFPRGFFLAYLLENGVEKIVGTVTSMPVFYDPQSLDRFKTWDAVTNNGYLFDNPDARSNAIYIVSGIIDRAYRGLHIFEAGVLQECRLAQELGMRYVVAGAVIPGYRRYCEDNGEVDAYDYCVRRRGRQLIDPLLALYETIGFAVADARHVIPAYYPDDASRNYAALVVRDLQRAPL